MPVTVFHQLSATTPDNTSYEIRPSHWNSSHAVSLAIAGLEVIGAFSNGGNVSFGTNGQSAITANAPAQSAQPVAVSGSNGSFTFSTLSMGNLNGLSHYTSNGSVVGSYTVPSTAGLISALNLSAGTTSGNVSAAVFSNSNGISFGLNGSTITGSVAAQSSLSFSNANGVSFGTAGSTLTASVAAQTVQTQNLHNVTLAGNTSGVMAQVSSGTLSLAGGNNITLSQVGNAITISGANAGGAQTGISGLQVSNTTYTSGTVTFQNANGISFGSSGAGGISASYTVPSTAGLISNINLSAGTTSGNLSAAVFSNSNGVSFGLNGSTLTGSVAAQSVQTQNLHNITLAGNTSGVMAQVSSGTLSLAGGNNITLSQNGNAITISGANAGGAQTGISGLVVSNTTYTSGTVTFQNANGISFGSSGANGISASYTVPTQTVQTEGLYAIGNTTGQSSSSTFDARTLSISGAGIASVGYSGNALVISVPSAGALVNFSGGTTSGNLGSLVFTNANGVSFQLNGSTLSGSVAAQSAQTQSNIQAISAGTTSANTGALIFSNSNGVSFGLNGQTMTASVAPGGAAISAAGSSQNAGTLVFSNSNGVSFGMNGSTITASASGAGASVSIYGISQTTGQSSSSNYALSALSFGGYGVISIGQSGGTIQISGPGTTNFANMSISAGTTSGSLGSLVFSNSNGVSFGLNGSTITASAAGGGGGVAIAASNSTFTSGTVVMSAAGGALTISNGAQSALFSVPAVSSISATGALSVSVNGSTISLGAPNYGTLSYWDNDVSQGSAGASQFGLGSVMLQPLTIGANLSVSALRQFVSGSFSSSSNSSYAGTLTVRAGLYTLNGSTLSQASSGSQTFAFTNTSNNSTGSLSGIRGVTIPFNANLTPGNYWLGLWSSSASANANWFTLSNVVQSQGAAVFSGNFAAASTVTAQQALGYGLWSTTSTNLPASIGLSHITGTNANNAAFINLYNVSA